MRVRRLSVEMAGTPSPHTDVPIFLGEFLTLTHQGVKPWVQLMVLIQVFLGHGLLNSQVFGQLAIPDTIDNREVNPLGRISGYPQTLSSCGVQIRVLLNEVFHDGVFGVVRHKSHFGLFIVGLYHGIPITGSEYILNLEHISMLGYRLQVGVTARKSSGVGSDQV